MRNCEIGFTGKPICPGLSHFSPSHGVMPAVKSLLDMDLWANKIPLSPLNNVITHSDAHLPLHNLFSLPFGIFLMKFINPACVYASWMSNCFQYFREHTIASKSEGLFRILTSIVSYSACFHMEHVMSPDTKPAYPSATWLLHIPSTMLQAQHDWQIYFVSVIWLYYSMLNNVHKAGTMAWTYQPSNSRGGGRRLMFKASLDSKVKLCRKTAPPA